MKGQVILKNLQWLGRHNPAFTPGSIQTAVAELLNPTSSILPYSAHLLIGRPTVAGSGRAYFNIEASKTKKVNFTLAMPTEEGTYPVYLDIFSNDQLFEDYRAAETVVIGIITGFTLKITNPPPAGTHWSAHFFSKEEGKFISPTTTPTIGEIWNCPFNPYGAIDLRVLVLDFVNKRTVHDQGNLGPIYSGKAYIYNCATRRLSEV